MNDKNPCETNGFNFASSTNTQFSHQQSRPTNQGIGSNQILCGIAIAFAVIGALSVLGGGSDQNNNIRINGDKTEVRISK